MSVRYILSVLSILAGSGSMIFSQTMSLERQVVASTGGYAEILNDLNFSYTVGEMATNTRTEDDIFIITEGFQQGDGRLLSPLSFTSQENEVQCPDIKDGQIIVSPTGCLGPYTIELAGPSDTISVDDVSGNYTFTELDSGNYRITVRGFTFCSQRDIVRVELKNNTCDTRYYTGITPNGDGKNDVWLIDNIEINQPNEVQIYDRWGNVVWKASNYNNHTVVWRGENQGGQDLPSGTYFYTLSIEGGRNPENKSGWVQLIR